MKHLLITIALTLIVWLFLTEEPTKEPVRHLRWKDDHFVASDGWFEYPKEERERVVDSLYEVKNK